MSSILGLDHGSHGAVSLLDETGRLIAIEQIPTHLDGPRGRPTISAPLLARLLRQWQPTRAFVEAIGPRPSDGCVGAFGFGQSKGIAEAVLGCLEIPFERITPVMWKRHHGIPAGKDNKPMALAIAIRKWPHMAQHFERVTDLDKAESALIGLCGLEREARR